ncbi:MAG TPA: helix-turn-helix transcriptional regulator [Pseudonocardiaceae bacterium]|jgi:transcriptional regulator with XRE-family HTH domain|nr:helix-turn-helix transcriptional regulator [Pseudonocardiaceae bacterium]
MSPVRGPVVPRRRLGAELRTLRDRSGLTIEDVAKELECSISKISRLETGQGIPKSRDVRDLLDRYGVTDQAHRDRLMRWVRDGQRQGWWHDYSDVLAPDPEDPLVPDNLSRFVALEQDASEVRSFETTVVPGLLQTEDYARAVLSTTSTADREATDRLVELRMRRQDRLYADEDPLTVHMVLDEALLRRPIGGEQVMRAQLKRLLADAQRPNITIQVLPLSIGAHRAMDGSFVVLAFPDSDDNDLVYVEGHLGDLYLEKEHDVEVYEQIFDALVDLCLSAEQSVTFVGKFLLDD